MVVGFQREVKLELVNGSCVEILWNFLELFLGVKRKRSSREVVVFVFHQPMEFADLRLTYPVSVIRDFRNLTNHWSL